MSEQTKCCICISKFNQNNFPRLMPSCDHSVCTNCLKNAFKISQSIIQCTICHNQQQITQPDLQYFPKNIGLIKNIKDSSFKKQSLNSHLRTPTKDLPEMTPTKLSQSETKNSEFIYSEQFVSNQSSLISKKSQSTVQNNNKNNKQICSTHNKQLQIICLTDFTKLCPLCAVFGIHKDHQLKTIDEASKILKQTYKQFQQTKSKKKLLDTKIKNTQFKTQLTQKLNQTRNNMSKQIKDKFNTLKQAITTAEKNANDDLNKKFKQVYEKINQLVKEQCQFQSFFNDWVRTVQLQLSQTNRIGASFQSKAKIYFQGNISSLKQGNFYLSQIEAYIEQKKHKLDQIPSQITIQVGQSLIKDIYNYLSVKYEDRSYPAYTETLLTSSRMNDRNADLSSFNSIVQSTINGNSYNNIPSSNKLSSTNSIQSNQGSTTTKKPIKVQFSSSQNFLSPNRDKIVSPSNISNVPLKKSPRKKSKSVPKQQIASSNNLLKSRNYSPAKKQTNVSTIQPSQDRKKYLEANTEQIVQDFLRDQHLDTLDLCAFDLLDSQIVQILEYTNNKKKIKCLKLAKNKLSNQGFSHILPYLKFTTNINMSFNTLTQEVLLSLMKNRQKVPNLRILNLASNKVNQRKAKVYVDQLKKQGIIVTL